MKTNKTQTLTITKAAEILGISRGLAYKLAKDGELPVLKLGNRMVIPCIKLNEFMKKGA